MVGGRSGLGSGSRIYNPHETLTRAWGRRVEEVYEVQEHSSCAFHCAPIHGQSDVQPVKTLAKFTGYLRNLQPAGRVGVAAGRGQGPCLSTPGQPVLLLIPDMLHEAYRVLNPRSTFACLKGSTIRNTALAQHALSLQSTPIDL